MFTPRAAALVRGWPGRIEGDRVVQLATQTLESFFTGGGEAREHAAYALAAVDLLPPILRPPSIRWFDDELTFSFGNTASVFMQGDAVAPPRDVNVVEVVTRAAAVIGAGEAIAGFTLIDEWRAPELAPPKDRDFAVGVGPVVVTRDELQPGGFEWEAARELAARNTVLRSGDLLVAPAGGDDDAVAAIAGAVLSRATG
jgi:hypothetical protein